MVAVRLARGWVGFDGDVHHPGDVVDVDAVTLARMEANGVVVSDDRSPAGWAGPTGDRPAPADLPVVDGSA
jgi:hypothetical protein